MKYLISDGRVGVIQEDQEISIKCYVEILKGKMVHTLGTKTRKVGSGVKPSGEACKGEEAPPPTNEEIED